MAEDTHPGWPVKNTVAPNRLLISIWSNLVAPEATDNNGELE